MPARLAWNTTPRLSATSCSRCWRCPCSPAIAPWSTAMVPIRSMPCRTATSTTGSAPTPGLGPAVDPVPQPGAQHGQPAGGGAQPAADRLGHPGQVRAAGAAAAGQRGDPGQHAVGRRPGAVQQPVDDPFGAHVQRQERQRHRHASPPRPPRSRPGVVVAPIRQGAQAAQHDVPAGDHGGDQRRDQPAAEQVLRGPRPPRRVATSTAPAIAMQASRENQNSSAIGWLAAAGQPRGRVDQLEPGPADDPQQQR